MELYEYAVSSGGSRADDKVVLCERCGLQLIADLNGHVAKSAEPVEEGTICEWCGRPNCEDKMRGDP